MSGSRKDLIFLASNTADNEPWQAWPYIHTTPLAHGHEVKLCRRSAMGAVNAHSARRILSANSNLNCTAFTLVTILMYSILNFERSVLRCIDADPSNEILVGKLLKARRWIPDRSWQSKWWISDNLVLICESMVTHARSFCGKRHFHCRIFDSSAPSTLTQPAVRAWVCKHWYLPSTAWRLAGSFCTSSRGRTRAWRTSGSASSCDCAATIPSLPAETQRGPPYLVSHGLTSASSKRWHGLLQRSSNSSALLKFKTKTELISEAQRCCSSGRQAVNTDACPRKELRWSSGWATAHLNHAVLGCMKKPTPRVIRLSSTTRRDLGVGAKGLDVPGDVHSCDAEKFKLSALARWNSWWTAMWLLLSHYSPQTAQPSLQQTSA